MIPFIIFHSINLEEQIKLDLWSPSSLIEPRYTLRVVDQSKKNATNGPFAVFLVPQGRFVINPCCSIISLTLL